MKELDMLWEMPTSTSLNWIEQVWTGIRVINVHTGYFYDSIITHATRNADFHKLELDWTSLNWFSC